MPEGEGGGPEGGHSKASRRTCILPIEVYVHMDRKGAREEL